MVGAGLVLAFLAYGPFTPPFSLYQTPQLRLAFGGVGHGLGILAAVLLGLVFTIPRRRRNSRVFLFSSCGSLILVPPVPGSYYIAVAVDQLASGRVDVPAAFLSGLLFYGALVSVIVVTLARRTQVHE
jgi:hypothetical protein